MQERCVQRGRQVQLPQGGVRGGGRAVPEPRPELDDMGEAQALQEPVSGDWVRCRRPRDHLHGGAGCLRCIP